MRPVHLERIFTYHPPQGDQAQRYEQLRAAGLVLADKINRLAPESAEKTLAIRRVQEAVMYANAAIACNEAPAIAAHWPPEADICPRCNRAIGPLDSIVTGPAGAKVHAYACGPASPQTPFTDQGAPGPGVP